MAFQIREMEKSDWQRISYIYQQGMDTNIATFETECPNYENFDTSHIRSCRFVITDNDFVIGWVALSPVSSRCVYGGVAEVSIYVDEAYKGKGAGTQLLSYLINQYEKAGYWTLQAGIMQDNLASIRLHEKCGFRMVGYREKIGKDRYGQWRNTVLMERRSTIDNLKTEVTYGRNSNCGCNETTKTEEMFVKKLNIDFLYLDLSTCERCIATGDTLDNALRVLTPVFETLNYSVTVNKVNITTEELAKQHRFISSPTIRVNGIDICAELVENECENCGDLAGCSVDCRVFVYEGHEYTQPPTSAIVRGILRVLYGQVRQDKAQAYELPENLKKYFIGRDNIMSKMVIYEPALCCETGVCGVSVDPELLRISTVANNLKKSGVTLQRYNLNNFPNEFIKNEEINKLINGTDGVDALPATVVDGKIVKTKTYPTNEEIVAWLKIPVSYLGEEKTKAAPMKASGGCDCEGGCC